METALHPHATLIDAIGRDALVPAVAKSRQLVHVWRQRGIPAKHWVTIRDMAVERDIPVSLDNMARAVAA